MKTIYRLLIMVAAPALLVGCVDLDYSEVTTNDEQWVYQSPVYGIERLVTSVYARVPNGIAIARCYRYRDDKSNSGLSRSRFYP